MTSSTNPNDPAPDHDHDQGEYRRLIERARELTFTNFDPDIVDDLANALERALARIDVLEQQLVYFRQAYKEMDYTDRELKCTGCMGPCGRCEEADQSGQGEGGQE